MTNCKYDRQKVKEKIHKKVMLLAEFYKEYGRIPKQKEEYDNIKLGVFLMNV